MGIITLTAVVVVGITIVGVSLIEKPQPQQLPATNIVIENYSHTVYMYHKGETLQKEGMLIMINGELHTADFIDRGGSTGWTEFKAGDTLLYDSPEMPNAVSLLYSAQGLEGGASGAAAASSATLFEVATNFRVAGNAGLPYYTRRQRQQQPPRPHRYRVRPRIPIPETNGPCPLCAQTEPWVL
jgi:hypothetical protein